jgi:hypothetical protein
MSKEVSVERNASYLFVWVETLQLNMRVMQSFVWAAKQVGHLPIFLGNRQV